MNFWFCVWLELLRHLLGSPKSADPKKNCFPFTAVFTPLSSCSLSSLYTGFSEECSPSPCAPCQCPVGAEEQEELWVCPAALSPPPAGRWSWVNPCCLLAQAGHVFCSACLHQRLSTDALGAGPSVRERMQYSTDT